eukprot:g48242.t1
MELGRQSQYPRDQSGKSLLYSLYGLGSQCHISGWKATCLSVQNVLSVTKHVAVFYACRIGAACGARRCPLLVFVNSKSGDNQGVKFLRRFKQLLNPAQVFDLMNGGPHLGLRLFQKFDTFRILVCGGDGSVGWVLSEIDSLNLHKQMGVLPLGTGNDLARVLGWGSACDDDTQLPQILEKLERASTKMLDREKQLEFLLLITILIECTCIWMLSEDRIEHDCDVLSQSSNLLTLYRLRHLLMLVEFLSEDRWGIMVYETKVPRHSSSSLGTEDFSDDSESRVLCETVKDFVARVGKAYERTTENWEESETMARKCSVLKEKLDSLLKTLNDESQAASSLPNPPPTIAEEQEDCETTNIMCDLAEDRPACSPRPQIFRPREQLMLRANSLKKAIRQIIEHAEKAVDEQNAQTQDQEGYTFGLCSEEERREPQTEDKISLHSSYSATVKGRVYRKANRDNLPMLNSKILYPSALATLGQLSHRLAKQQSGIVMPLESYHHYSWLHPVLHMDRSTRDGGTMVCSQEELLWESSILPLNPMKSYVIRSEM